MVTIDAPLMYQWYQWLSMVINGSFYIRKKTEFFINGKRRKIKGKA